MKEKYRPQIDIERTSFDKFIDNFGFAALLVLLIVPIMAYSDLPDTIPIHFNVKGEADGFGAKYTIFMLPIIGCVTYALMKYLVKQPHLFNYPVEITPENVHYQYEIATRMMRTMNAVVTLIFAYLTYVIIQTAQGNVQLMGTWSLPLILAVIFVPIFYFVWKAKRRKI